METKYIRVNACYDYEDGDGEPTIELNHYDNFFELLRIELSMIDEWRLQLILEEAVKSPVFVKALKQIGFVNTESIKDREEKIVAKKKFYIIRTDNFGYTRQIDELNDNTLNYRGDDLLKGHLVQEVDVSCLKDLAPKAYESYLYAKKKSDAAKKAAAARKKKTAEKNKQKEIEKAKKLLKEVGELK